MKWVVIGAAVLLAGCGEPVTQVRVETIQVPVPTACPDRGAYEKLKADRPRPLREQPMPETAQERVDKQAAQLGRYEAEGAWADRVEATLDRCQLDGQG